MGDASVQYIKNSDTELIGVDWKDDRTKENSIHFSDFFIVDIEKENLPFDDDSFDIDIMVDT